MHYALHPAPSLFFFFLLLLGIQGTRMEDLASASDYLLLIIFLLLTCSCSYLLLLQRRRSSSSSSSSSNGGGDHLPPPGGGIMRWLRGVAGLETLSFLVANSSGRGFYHFVRTRALRYGPCFRTILFARTHVFLLSSPPAVSLILTVDPPHLSKRYVRTVADLLGDHSLLCTSHSQHRSMRRAVAGLFTSASTAAFAATFDRLTTTLMQQHSKGTAAAVVVLDAALDITFRAICEMLMGAQEEAKLEQLRRDVTDVTQAMLALPLRLPGTRFYRGLQARTRIVDALKQEISSRRRSRIMEQRNDFLQSLLLSQQQQQQQQLPPAAVALTDAEIVDNILTLIIAGQVTTATAITWMVKYLADDTHLQDKLRALQLELHHPAADVPLTLQHLNAMDFAYMAVKESLRMATIVTWFPRVALEDCNLAGFSIKKDWIVNVDARSIHYDPTIYDNPTVFDPSRFDQHVKKKPFTFLAFGAGGRTCLGMNLAKIMMLIFLHRLVTNFRWEMADHDPSLEKWAMFPRLKNGCPIHLTPLHSNN